MQFAGADSINVFPSFTRLLTEQHSGQVQERGNVHLALEAKSSVTQRLVDTGEITASQRLRQFIEWSDKRGRQGDGEPVAVIGNERETQ